jgi:CheY-like chemotaxis protein
MVSEVGVGTTFVIYLPTADRHLQQLQTVAAMAPNRNEAEVILCVEDDAIVRRFVSDQLRRLGYRTIVASNGREALDVVESDVRIDLMFTDVIMPGGMDGWQLAQQVKKRRPVLRVLYTTGYSDSITQHLGSGADILLLPKPYRSAELERMVRIALDSFRQLGPHDSFGNCLT